MPQSRNSDTRFVTYTIEIDVEVESDEELKRVLSLIEQRTGFEPEVKKPRKPYAKMTPELLDEARSLLTSGRTYSEVAKSVGCSRAALHKRLPGLGMSKQETMRKIQAQSQAQRRRNGRYVAEE